MKFRNLLYSIVGLALVLNVSGCWLLVAGAAGGAGTAYWLSGKLSDEVSASSERTTQATEKALASLNMSVMKKTVATNVTQIISKYTDGSDVWIDIRPISTKTTKIEVRVGVPGDKAASTKILEKIKSSI